MESIKEKSKDPKNNIYKIVMIFTIGCFLGCIFETGLCYIQRGYFESRKGLIYGPFNPVYGFAMVVVTIFLEKEQNNILLYLKGFLLGGIVEYFCSWIQEIIFKTSSWNYNSYFLNFNGRTSIYHMVWWGILSFLYIKLLHPMIIKIIYKIKEDQRIIIMCVLTIFFTIDAFISSMACIRRVQRINGNKPSNNFERFIDKHYNDEVIKKVYPNLKDPKTLIKISKMK